VDLLLGDATKAKEKLGWVPKYSLSELAKEMVDADIEHFKKDIILKESGYNTLRQFE
jgi:GDPmannose 4,6-dehydratase